MRSKPHISHTLFNSPPSGLFLVGVSLILGYTGIMNNDSRLCDKCGLLPQTGSKPKPPCKPKCKKRCKKDCCENDFVFRKVVIPAALGDDVNGKDTPANGAYVNAYVEYEANGAQYMYDSYGVYTKLEVKSQEGVTNFDELSGRPKYAGNPMTSATDIPDVMSAPTFKPFPDGVVTDGTTQQFMNSILALDPTVGTAYMGTVELSDMPAGLIQEEVEVYVYNSYTIYCIMRSTDVAPYSWWCASYNYQGWQPIGSGGGMTIFYANSQETGATRHIYKDDHFTETASVQDLLDANEEGPITLRITIYPNVNGVFSDAYIQNTYVGENDYQFLFLDERTYREYTASTTSDTTFYYFSNVIQTQLTAGSNIQINGTTISATDTTYSDFTGTDGTSAGTAGLVPAPATTDAGKYLKADGTWDSVQAGPTVVQTTGTSTTDVMSQVATTNMIYPSGNETNSTNIFIKGGGQGGPNYVCIGPAQVSGNVDTSNGATAIGGGAMATGTRGVAIAAGSEVAQASGNDSIAIRGQAKATNSIAIGRNANVASASTGSIAIGYNAGSTTSAPYAVALGRNAYANSSSIAIGDGSSTSGNDGGIAIGKDSRAFGSDTMAIGENITTTGLTGSVVIGNGPSVNTAYATRNNEFCVHASTTANQPMVHSNVDAPTLGTDAANKNYVDSIYPVGAVFTSTSATAPTIAGGTWTEIGTQTIGSSTVHYYERTA